ncbi:MAG: hypothetical protein VKJ24_16320 [Synechococcales bacterium]|nr:hypothetical protein [Synechococcales bacterium]
MNSETTEPKANLQLVESIVQLIRSLSSTEQSILEQKLYPSVLKSPAQSTKLPEESLQSILEFFEEIHHQGPFRTPEQIDRDLQAERDAWDS